MGEHTDQSSFLPINPFNYEEWKLKTPIFLKRKRIFGITMGAEMEPLFDVENPKLLNRFEKSYGILCLYVSPSILD